MLFQHISSYRVKDDLILFGRTPDGSCALHTPLNPTLLTATHPQTYFDKMDDSDRFDVMIRHCQVIKGYDITNWRERVFFKSEITSCMNFFCLRKWLREDGVDIFDDQIGLESQWFVQRNLRPCSVFEVEGHLTNRITTCKHEFRLSTIQPSDELVETVNLSYDIECLLRPGVFPDASRDPIITIGTYCKSAQRCFCWNETPGYDSYPDERSMICGFLQYVVELDPDFISGHNISRFDNVYVEKRCQILRIPFTWSRIRNHRTEIRVISTSSNQKGTQVKYRVDIPGRVLVDSYEVFRDQHKEKSYKLDDLAKKYIGQQKDDMPYHLIPEKFKTADGRAELAKYCVQDCKLVHDLLSKLNKITNLMAMGKVTGCSADDILYRGQGIRTITLMLYYARDRRIHIPQASKSSTGYKGAVVLPPKSGMYEDMVICVDFASLYPSIMQAMNMCYSTIVSRAEIEANGWVEGEDVRTVPDYEWVDGKLVTTHNPENTSFITTKVRQGVLPLMLSDLLSERKVFKKKMKEAHGTPLAAVYNGVQLALKVVANSIYGFTNAFILPNPAIASSVTKYGRGLTLRTMSVVNNNPRWKGSEVIYGDSVSGDTPVLIRHFGVVKIVEIRDLVRTNEEEHGKMHVRPRGLEVWSDTGWTKVKAVMRHWIPKEKKMFRIRTDFTFIDVTEDHSLLRPDGTPVKPEDADRDLMRTELPGDIMKSDMTYMDAFMCGMSFRSTAPTLEWLNVKSVPLCIVFGSDEVVHGFIEGCKVEQMKEDTLRFETASKLDLFLLTLLAKRCGFGYTIKYYRELYRVQFTLKEVKPFFVRAEAFHDGLYVYDLSTESEHFHVGPGDCVVHNTDSCFVRLSRDLCNGATTEEYVSNAHRIGNEMGEDITKNFLPPVLMEYESCFPPPFCLLKKKRYFAWLVEAFKEASTKKLYIKGLECIRRDFCELVNKTQYAMIKLILEMKIEEAVYYVQGVMSKLYAGEVDVKDLILSKKLSQPPEAYKTLAPHVELAKRLAPNGPQAGERVYYLIRAGPEPLNKRAILESEIGMYRLDYRYYAEKQLKEPIQRVLDVVVGRKVFRSRAVTAPIKSGSLIKYLKVGERRKKRKVEEIKKSRLTDADIRSFFG